MDSYHVVADMLETVAIKWGERGGRGGGSVDVLVLFLFHSVCVNMHLFGVVTCETCEK